MSTRFADDSTDLRLPDLELTFSPPTPEQQRQAALAVCDYAQDATAARPLLEMLGLIP